ALGLHLAEPSGRLFLLSLGPRTVRRPRGADGARPVVLLPECAGERGDDYARCRGRSAGDRGRLRLLAVAAAEGLAECAAGRADARARRADEDDLDYSVWIVAAALVSGCARFVSRTGLAGMATASPPAGGNPAARRVRDQ